MEAGTACVLLLFLVIYFNGYRQTNYLKIYRTHGSPILSHGSISDS